MPSLVIPAHNEESVLKRTLDSVLADLEPGEIDVIVVCNGCTDRSVEIAQSYAPMVKVLDLQAASKVIALNAGDTETTGFPRIYLDADIGLSTESLRLLISHLQEPEALSAEPVPTLDVSKSGVLVRAWYAVWTGLYGTSPGKIGSGVLGLSEQGRSRFTTFPDVTADDAFVRAHFTGSELVFVQGATSRVMAPRTLGDLIKIKTRSRLGSAELAQRFPELWARQDEERPAATQLTRLPWRLWPLAPWYLAVTLFVRQRAKSQAKRGDITWERDESSRQ